MFRRINLEEENSLARECESESRSLKKEDISKHRIHTFTAVMTAALLLFYFISTQIIDGIFTGGAIAFLIMTIFHWVLCHRRLHELRAIRDFWNP